MLCTRQLWYHFSSRGDKGCGSDWIKVTCRLLSRSIKRSEKGTVDRLGCCSHHHHAQRTWGWFTKIATTTILLTLGPHSSVGTCHMNLASGQWEILQCQEPPIDAQHCGQEPSVAPPNQVNDSCWLLMPPVTPHLLFPWLRCPKKGQLTKELEFA